MKWQSTLLLKMISSTSSEGSKNTPQDRPEDCSQGSDQSLTHLSKLSANGDSDYETVTKDSGQLRLQELGYRQELRREFGLLSSTAAGFAVMSYLLGITSAHATSPALEVPHILPWAETVELLQYHHR